MSAVDVIVVGGGVIGCSVAYALSSRGVRVRVLERDSIGAHASSAAAGMLAPIAESDGRGPLLTIGLEALARLPATVQELRERTGIDPELVLEGLIRLHPKGRGEKHGDRERRDRLARLGVELWEADRLRGRLPEISPAIETAEVSPREGSIDPERLTHAFAEGARRAGAILESGTAVTGLERSGDRVVGVRSANGLHACHTVVWCPGAWASRGVADLALPVEPVRGQMLAVRAAGMGLGALGPKGGPVLWGEDVYLVPRPEGTIRVGATVERVGFDARPTLEGVSTLARAAMRLVPQLAAAPFETAWAGLRPATPDGLPIVGRPPCLDGLLLAVGHGRHGILLCERTGHWIAQLLHGESPPGIERLSPSRLPVR